MRKKRILAGIMSLLLIFTSVFTGNIEVRAQESGTIRFNDQTAEGEGASTVPHAYEYGYVSYKIGTGQWREAKSADGITITTTDTVYFRLIAKQDYQVDMVRNVSLNSTKPNSSLQILPVQTDDENGKVTEVAGAQYFMFTPETDDSSTLYDYEVCFGFEAVSQEPSGDNNNDNGIQYGNGALKFNVNNNGNGGTVTFAVTSSSIGDASGTTYTVGGDSNYDDPTMKDALSDLQFVSGDTITISATPNTEANYKVSQFSVLVNGVSRNVSTAIVDGKVTSFMVTITGDEASKPVEVNVDFQGQNSSGSDNNGKIRFLCQSNPVTGGHVRVRFDASSYVGVPENENSYGTIDLPQDASNSTVVYFKFETSSGYSLDTGRGVIIWVNGEKTSLTANAEGAYIYTLPESPLEKQYELEFGWESGNGGSEQQNVSFSCSSMNGNENERVNAVKVWLNEAGDWVDYCGGALNSLTEGTTFKVRIEMKDGFTIDKVSLDYESFDRNSRVGYFKEIDQPNYDDIIAALLSLDGYAITFQPEDASKDANGNSTLQANSACLRLQYQTAISYAAKVDINMFFQTKNGDNGYGVWTRDNNGADVFVDGVGDSEVKFSFNGNNYGENGNPFDLGYGKKNTGNNPIQVSYVSAYAGNERNIVDFTPETYDYFSAGGYTTGDNTNIIRIDNYDGLIDEVYIDVDGDNSFEASEKLTAKDGHDPNIGQYLYYEETLNAATSYNILVRKHLSTRVSLKWSYTETGTDYYVDHGKIFIEKVVRDGVTLLQADTNNNGDLVLVDGVPNTKINALGNDYGVTANAGEAFLERGDVVTIRLIPTYGYQIKEAKLNGVVPLTPNEKVSSFTFTVDGNLHLAGNFIKTSDVIDTDGAAKISDANIVDGQNATDSGNLKLTVEDHSGTYEKATDALALARGENAEAETVATLDMTLDSMVSKGNDQYWTENISEFANPIDVKLNLNDSSYVSGDTYVVIREHNGTLERIDATYENGTLTVPTNKFSTYTIVKKSAVSSNGGSGNQSGSGSGSTSSSTTDTNTPVLVETITATTPKTETTTQTKPATKNEQTNTETTIETEKPISVSIGEGSEGWTDIKTKISDKLEEATEIVEVVVEMNGEDTVPADIFESIKGQDVTVSFDMGNGIVWAVNGMDITGDNLESINFSASTGSGVTVIPAELISGLGEDRFTMELTLEHEGEFGFTAVMTVNVDQKNAGKYANLFYFNPTDEAMEFICSAPVKEDGTADLTFTHASDYVIVVDEASMSEEHNISLANVRETVSEETPEEVVIAENDTWNPIWIIAIGAAIIVIGGIVVFTVKKKHD